MPRYSEQPYGLKPNTRVQFPQNAHAISTAPQATARPIWVYEQNGQRHAALFHKGQWMKVTQFPRDSHTGQTRVAMDGTVVHNPIAWSSS
jgi:hypothetical protein